jgi:tRNA G18 (ribose-2'-O)-methylase SpoU
MRCFRVDAPGDTRLAPYAGVAAPERLRADGLLIAEGRFVVRRLLDAHRGRVRSLLLNDAAFTALADVLAGQDDAFEVYVAPAAVIEGVAGFHLHHGCLALADRPEPLAPDRLLRTSTLVVVLERVSDADNVGGVFRSGEAFGVDAVLVSPGSADPFYRKAIRTSSGAGFLLPWAHATPWPDVLDDLRAAGFAIVALTPDREATPLGEFAATTTALGRVAVLAGTEGQGLTVEALARADVRVRIPMSGALDSLNVATAVSIALQRFHEVRLVHERARRSAGACAQR